MNADDGLPAVSLPWIKNPRAQPAGLPLSAALDVDCCIFAWEVTGVLQWRAGALLTEQGRVTALCCR